MTVDGFVVGRNGDAVRRVAMALGRETRDDLAVPQHVVGYQQSTRTEQSYERIEHWPVLFLFAVLEDHVERTGDLVKHPLRVADDDVDAIGETSSREILASHLGACLVDLHRDEEAVLRQRAGHPHARIPNG